MTKRTSVRQRRVSAELRTLRMAAGMTCKEVSDGLGFSESKISRMETGDRGLYADDVSAILGFLHAPTEKRQELLKLLREGEERNWHEIHGKLPPTWKELIRFEESAAAIKNYEPLVMPGLAQTPEYARALMHGIDNQLTEPEVEKLVAARLNRQVVLSRHDGPAVHLLIEESVLHRTVGDLDVMRAQLQNLQLMMNRSRVTIRVVPSAAGTHPGLEGPLALLEFIDEPSLAYAETHGASNFLEDEEPVARVKRAWKGLIAVALAPQDSARLIARVIGNLNSSGEPEP
ncbi:helix-turn-helix transcriptional regulator [Amycolatopsis carbonis]|uniref:Helix-turn-helix transcriptional regulator n=1 Tax=Amycolatopsis carbonis TaxID=715471 RepID=A0A9Y2MX15_9PSEU|nr:helix-turn-helix transcriptional regulator [Amycolatopsis sp. 2-15]WIX80273.1 helix-turn-helix transcriptional regulator [Amycolatopsis sp. 2-15]